jgi:quercetin dioxygenase-like cupin family protein
MTEPGLQPVLNTRADASIRFLGIPTLMRATGQTTNGAFGLLEHLLPPGFASPYHTHHREDEAFYVIEGEVHFVCGGRWLTAGPGTYVFGPRNIPHGFKVPEAAPARMLLLCTPAGFEQFVLDLHQDSPVLVCWQRHFPLESAGSRATLSPDGLNTGGLWSKRAGIRRRAPAGAA